MSWMKRDNGHMNGSYRNQLLTWAKTEYKKDWQFAYQFMLDHNGKAPTRSEINGVTLWRERA